MTNFTDYSTVVQASWLNHVDSIAYDPAIEALAGVAPDTDKLPYFSSATAAALATFTATGRAIVGSATPAAVLSAIGGAPSDNPTFTGTVSADDISVGGDLLFPNAASRFLLKGTSGPIGDRTLFQCSDANQNTVFGAVPNGTATLAAVQCYNNSDLSAPLAYVDIRSGPAIHTINSGAGNGGSTLPLQISTSAYKHRFEINGNLNFCGASDPGFGGEWRGLAMIGGSVANGSYVRLSNSDSTAVMDLLVGSGFQGTIRTATPTAMNFQTNAVTRMSISSTGYATFGGSTVDSRTTLTHLRDSNPYALIIKAYSSSGVFECDTVFGQTAIGFESGTYQSFPWTFKTNNTERFRLGADGKATFTMPDAAIQWMFSGTTKGIRVYTSTVGSAIEGVDYTGTGSYQPLIFSGSYLSLGVSGSEKARITANGTTASRTTGYMNRTSQSTSTTTHTIDWTASNYYQLTMGHNIATLTLTAPEYPCVVQLDIIQDSGGSKTMAWPASIKWPGNYTAADKTISTASNARDLLILRWNGTDYVANLMKGIA